MSHKPAVFIASSSYDRATTAPVINKVKQRGAPVILYESDRVFSGEAQFAVRINNEEIIYQYDGQELRNDDIRSAWYRRPGIFSSELEDRAKYLSIQREVREINEGVWSIISESKWLNSPYQISRAENKLGQLSLAKAMGMNIPNTVISNNWDDVRDSIPDEEIIVKMPYGVLYENNKTKTMYSHKLSKVELDELHEASPFPAIFQSYVSKYREWRLTIVGDETFDAAIYTDDDAKDDWRKKQSTASVRFCSERIDSEVRDKCLRLIGRMGLRFGTVDLIEEANGRITFLEVNPNGQYMWLEKALDFPISDALATELLNIRTGL